MTPTEALDKKRIIDDFEDRLANDCLRVAVGNDLHGYSGQWRFWGSKTDLYFGVRSIVGSIKVSLHASGVCRVALTEQFARKLSPEKLPKGGDRVLTKWRRPSTPDKGALHVSSVLFPTGLFSHEQPPGNKLNILFDPAPEGHAIELGLFFHKVRPDDLSGPLAELGVPLASYEFLGPEWVSFVLRQVPFDAQTFLETTQRKLPGKVTPFMNMSKGQPVEGSMIVWNDAEKDGHLRFYDAGGVTVTKNRRQMTKSSEEFL